MVFGRTVVSSNKIPLREYRHPDGLRLELTEKTSPNFGALVMSVAVQPHVSIIVASLWGALVWVMTHKKQFVAFCISFLMGILGADVTLEVIKTIITGVFSDERAVGAFFCSALVIPLIHRFSLLRNQQKNEK